MCLGIPGVVVEIMEGNAGQLAIVDVLGAQRQVNIGMLEAPPSPGEWIVIHMGFAMEVVDEAQAREAMSGLQLMGSGRADRSRRRFEVHGVVQGVGFRPHVYATAATLGLSGSVANTAAGVVAEVEGDPDAVDEFGRLLCSQAPPLAEITEVRESALEPQGGTGFTIERSGEPGSSQTLASPDVTVCAECLAELADPLDRRYRHAFITCTNCGPRFTIITELPYDRATTTMADFAMCRACADEYADPADRRFHAQPVSCPDCGPQLTLVHGDRTVSGDRAVREARGLLAQGLVVAVKGLGGYHLACDARNESAVAELRRRKQRGAKPFALMARDVDAAVRIVTMDDDERRLLTGLRRPIVLLAARPDAEVAQSIAQSVAPGNPDLGVMLPYTPLHVLLLGIEPDLDGPDLLVMTSGNLSGEPIAHDDADARRRLSPLVDAWLTHDREIQVPCDDSVTRHVAGAELPVRRSRGYAPLPLALPFDIEPMLAVGADLKNTCALAGGRYAWVSPHIGDMDDLATLQVLTDMESHLERLTGVTPTQLVADAHPGYRSSGWARTHADGRPVHLVQHHHAHIASVMGEHGVPLGEQVIGFAFDGTGYGTDGAVWGGEVLVAGYKSFRRAAHLAYVPLAGGDASVLRPYRMAMAHLRAAGVPWDPALPCVAACPEDERAVLDHQLTTGLGCTPTSSMGRLFDSVASLAGVRHTVDFEAEAAVELEGLARSAWPADGGYAFDGCDAGPVVRAVADDVRAGVPVPVVAARFHAAVVRLVVDLAEQTRRETGIDVVALGGGVFGNALLLGATQHTLIDRHFDVLRPRALPPNDGGIALGQILIAASG